MKKKGSPPLSALFDTSRRARVELSLLSERGNVPYRLLPARDNTFSLVRLAKISGNEFLLNSLSPRLRTVKLVKVLNQAGTVPLSLFPLK